ncbi:hypothetical protein [Roseomonas sp. KE0001]|uniref:hypothetical protein n=1 Tax=Roseomonas sp. KE0001 TaxID=2479201 RepID=UPI0018DF1A6A|nr:hypothetical protein [Roseomonas sp. KE0001]MBI0432986.1 hypothetical protein [Roseomonas sp. KE0001]
MSETVSVGYEVLGVEPVLGAGRLVALAVVAVEVAGLVVTLQGVQVNRAADGSLSCAAPVFRHPRTGRWLPAVSLPQRLSEAVAAEVLATAREKIAQG